MAKRTRSTGTIPNKVVDQKTIEVNIADILKHAEDSSNPVIYANYAQFGVSINGNELLIDFYRVEPKPGTAAVSAIFLQRAIIPAGLGKGFAIGLANTIDQVERATGITIPNQRHPLPEDTMKIWE
jgi:hypothetical protein